MIPGPAGVLLIGGAAPPLGQIKPLLESATMIVAADSGFDLALAYGITPDLLVGDQDSMADPGRAERILGNDRIIRFDTAKDETDTEIGLRMLCDRGAGPVAVIGGGGGRLDHLVGILSLFDRERRPKWWFTDRDEIVEISNREAFQGMKGALCSFFPVGNGPCVMHSEGLKWPLDGLTWNHGDVGISNIAIKDEVVVEMITGRLIMVRGLGGQR